MTDRHGIDTEGKTGPARLAPSLALSLALALGAPGPLTGQDLDKGSNATPHVQRTTPPTLQAHRLTTPPTLDGLLTEPDWGIASVATGFTVFKPNEGEAPSQRTEARVLFGD